MLSSIRTVRPRHALILAGGQSARYGSYKALISVKGEPIIATIIRRLHNAGFSIHIAIKHEEQYRELLPVLKNLEEDNIHVTVIFDCMSSIFHPLIPIYTFSRTVDTPFLVVACDMPYIGEKSAKYLYDLARLDVSAVVPRWSDGKVEPLFAVYNPCYVRMLPVLEYVKNGISMRKFIKLLGLLGTVIYVPVEQLFLLEQRCDIFVNINEPL